MFCRKCGKLLADNSEFCNYCGERVSINNSNISLAKPNNSLKCSKCLSKLDTNKECCESCGAYNPYYGTDEDSISIDSEKEKTTDENHVNLRKPTSVSSSQQPIQYPDEYEYGSPAEDNHNIRRWVILVVVIVIIALIMLSSDDSDMRGTGQSLMRGVLKSGLRVGAIVFIPFIIRAIVKAVKKNK